MEKIVEIARFRDRADAQILLSVLRADGIECNLRNELTTQIMSGYADTGGAVVEVLESDVPQALAIMKEGGYEVFNPESESERRINWLISITSKIPFVKNLSNEAQIIVFLLLIALAITAILYPFITK